MIEREAHRTAQWEMTLAELSGDGTEGAGKTEVSFLHKGFCIAGLPLRRPHDAGQTWSRQDGRFALTVAPSRFILPNGLPVDIGVPYGPKARLLTMWLTTEARDPSRGSTDRWIEMGRITEWLQAVGLPVTGGERGSIGATKDQLIRLAFANFTMVLRGEDATTLFKREVLIEAGAFGGRDLEMWQEGRTSPLNWPRGIKLSANAFERFRNHSVPVPTARLRQVAHNALSIDLLVYLCFRLPLIEKGESELVPWQELNAQFGTSEFKSRFRQASSESLRNALEAYPEAQVDVTDEGLVLKASDPLELRKAFLVARPGGVPRTVKLGTSPAPARGPRKSQKVIRETRQARRTAAQTK